MRKNCSKDREKLLKLEVEVQEFEHFLRSQEQFIQTVIRSEQFLQQNNFLTCFSDYLIHWNNQNAKWS